MLKYFYYISKTKVEMLLPQLKTGKFSSFSINPKAEIAGVSIGVDLQGQKDKSLVSDTQELIKQLQKHKLLAQFDNRLEVSQFYHSNNTCHHGLFYFEVGIAPDAEETLSVTVVYTVWMVHQQSLVLLVGSSNNILGEKTANDGIVVYGSSGAIDSVHSFVNQLMPEEPRIPLYQDGPGAVSQDRTGGFRGFVDQIGGEYGGLKSESRIVKFKKQKYKLSPTPYQLQKFLPSDFLAEAKFRKNLYASSLAIFCMRHLANLQQAKIDTVFKLFSEYQSSNKNLFLDLKARYGRDMMFFQRRDTSEEERAQKEAEWQTILAEAKTLGLEQCKSIFVGSPIYTALE